MIASLDDNPSSAPLAMILLPVAFALHVVGQRFFEKPEFGSVVNNAANALWLTDIANETHS